MSNLIDKKIPPLTEEQIEELKALERRKIDYSDIPPTTKEEFARMKANRLRRKNLKKIA